MGKKELLQQIKNLSSEHILSKEEILGAYNEGTGEKEDKTFAGKLKISEILYYIGGAIVFLGISVLIWQNWTTLNIFAKILATLGAGIAAYSVGMIFSKYKQLDAVGQAFFLISALVTPIGLFVVFDNAGFDMGSYGSQSLISGILFAVYLASYFVFRKNIFILFSIIFGTWLFFGFTGYLVDGNPSIEDWDFFEYRALLTGLAYIFLGYSFSKDEKEPLSGFLYGFGIMGFLGTALVLGGWSPNQNIFWELIFPGLVLGTIFLSVHLKSKAFLVFGSAYLMIYIVKITAEYFTEGLGWPLSLVLAGLTMMGIGYFSLYLSKKYISS